MMEAELERRNAELIDVRQQLESAQAAVDQESKWCQTDVDELAELREELRKTVEELDVKQNEDGLLREQLQSQRAEIDALHGKVFLRLNATLADLLQPSLPRKMASQMHPEDQLCDVHCHLANMIEYIHKISFAYGCSIEQCRLLPNYFGTYYYCYWQQPPNCLSVVSFRYLIQ